MLNKDRTFKNNTATRKPYYDLIMKAKNLKIIGLSGTPVVKEPIELAYLFNMLHGRNKLHILKIISVAKS